MNKVSYEIDIDIQCPDWEKEVPDLQALARETVTKTVESVFQALEKETVNTEISLVFADDTFVQELNRTYRGKDKSTNVLSFPLTTDEELNDSSDPFIALGDIIVAHGVIKQEAQEQDKSIIDHLKHMLVHGTLHLLHFDHIKDEDAEVMEALEIKILDELGVKNPYQND